MNIATYKRTLGGGGFNKDDPLGPAAMYGQTRIDFDTGKSE